jgi:hypothetical protein
LLDREGGWREDVDVVTRVVEAFEWAGVVGLGLGLEVVAVSEQRW